MKIEQVRLDNGLETVFVDSPGSTAASVQIWFRAGSALEQKENQGIAHFLEHMFFKGSINRPGHLIAEEVENFGGEVNAFTSFDYTCYYINTPYTHIQKSVEILLDMVSNPLFGQDELIPERDVVFEEYRRSLDNPSQFHFKEIQKKCFTKGYQHPILGTEKTIKNFTREQITEFREKFYNLSNSMLIVAGNLENKKDLVTKIQSFKLPSGPLSTFEEFKLKKNESISLHHKDVRQTTINITIQAPGYDDDNVSGEDLAMNCLAHGESSHLYHHLVSETSLASSVSGSTMYFHDGGSHFLRITCPTENIDKVLTKTTQILQEIQSNGLKELEVTKIKNQYIASKIFEKESIESFSFGLGHGFAQNGNIYSEDDFIMKIKQASARDVSLAFQNILQKNWHITLQTPKEVEHTKLKEKVEKIIGKFKNTLKNQVKLLPDYQKENTSKYDQAAKEIILKEGISLVYRKNTMTPTFVLHTYLKGGLSAENEANCGIHNLIARCITYGNKQTNYDQLKEELEFKSAYLSGFSGKNAYGMTMHGQSEHLERLSEIFINTLLTPTFPAKYFSLEKKLIQRSIENQKEDPVKQVFKSFQKYIFKKHPYSLDQMGNEGSIKKISLESLSKLHQQNLKKSQMTITYCGSHDLADVLNFLSPLINELKSRKSLKTSEVVIEKSESKTFKIKFQREQSHLFIGKKSHSLQHKDDVYLNMFSTYLSGQSSVLFTEIRDKLGLCYTIQPVHHSALESGYWGIYMASGPEKLEQGIKSIFKILKDFSTKGLSQNEFDLVKKMIEGQNLLSNQTNDDFANFYSVPALHGLGIDYQHKRNGEISKCKLEEFNKFLKKFLSDEWVTVYSGP